MLKGIPPIISPRLMSVMMEMGHGDELVLGDANFPAESNAARIVRCDGHKVPELLTAILQFFPLDTYVKSPVALMQTNNRDATPDIWNVYREIIGRHTTAEIELVERFAFYERSRKAYAIVATGETNLYANVILTKGVVMTQQ